MIKRIIKIFKKKKPTYTRNYQIALQKAKKLGYIKEDITKEELSAIREVFKTANSYKEKTGKRYFVRPIVSYQDGGLFEVSNLKVTKKKEKIKSDSYYLSKSKVGFNSIFTDFEHGRRAYNRYIRTITRARRLGYLKEDISREELNAMRTVYENAVLQELKTGKRNHVDHIIPVEKGGLHEVKNIQIVSPEYNLTKSDTIDPIKYPEQKPLL